VAVIAFLPKHFRSDYRLWMALFHVACPYTGRGVCQCSHGTPASLQSASAAARYSKQATAAWEFWQSPGKALGRDDPMEVLVSPLAQLAVLSRPASG
jgi:hypothetical protein